MSKKIIIRLPNDKNNVAKVPSDILQKYLQEKHTSVYHLPSGKFKIMKGSFFNSNCDKIQQTFGQTGWWFSEKLDGVHAIWTGHELITRTGNKIVAPEWWIKHLPTNVALAGELFISRKNFGNVSGAVRTHVPNSLVWREIKLWLFDVPDCKWPFREVYQLLKYVANGIPVLEVIEQGEITSLNDFLDKHKSLVASEAEGTIIRDPNAVYIPGVTDRLLKFKSGIDACGNLVHVFDDNAIIIGYNLSDKWFRKDGSPSLKSLRVQWESDDEPNSCLPELSFTEFSVSGKLTKVEKCGDYPSMFPIGAKIKVLYNELNDSGKPRFPRFGGMVV